MKIKDLRPLALVVLIGAITAATYFVGVSNGEKARDAYWISAFATSQEESDSLIDKQNKEIKKQEALWKSYYEEQVRNARTENALLTDRLDRARAASDELQLTISEITAQLQSRAGSDLPPTAGKRKANPDPGVLLAVVLGELDAAAGEFAQEADDARKRGARCEAFYTKVTGGESDY